MTSLKTIDPHLKIMLHIYTRVRVPTQADRYRAPEPEKRNRNSAHGERVTHVYMYAFYTFYTWLCRM